MRSANVLLPYLDICYMHNKMVFTAHSPVIVLAEDAPKYIDDTDPESETVESGGFGGIPLHLDNSNSIIFVPWQHCFLDTCNRVVDYIMDLFSQALPATEVTTNVEHVLNIPFHKWYLRLVQVIQMKKEPPLTQEQLKFLMEKLSLMYGGCLDLDACVEEETRYSDGLWHDKFMIDKGEWLDINAIRDSDSTFIDVCKMGPPRAAELNALLKDLVSTDKMSKLRKLCLKFDGSIPMDEVLEGVETTSRRDSYFEIQGRNNRKVSGSIRGNTFDLSLRSNN